MLNRATRRRLAALVAKGHLTEREAAQLIAGWEGCLTNRQAMRRLLGATEGGPRGPARC